MFLLRQKEISRLARISIDINLLSTDFPFKTKGNLKIRKDFQLISTYFQLIFLLTQKEISRLERISIDVNLRSVDFPFKTKGNLKISKDSTWYQPTLNWFSF